MSDFYIQHTVGLIYQNLLKIELSQQSVNKFMSTYKLVLPMLLFYAVSGPFFASSF